jgi:hypothetical protein
MDLDSLLLMVTTLFPWFFSSADTRHIPRSDAQHAASGKVFVVLFQISFDIKFMSIPECYLK